MLQKESEMLTFLNQKFLEENLSTNAGSRSDIDVNIENMVENDEILMSLRLKVHTVFMLFYRWAVLVISVAFYCLCVHFSLLMPYWLVYVSHVEDRFFNTPRL
jgi:hypothetical protein